MRMIPLWRCPPYHHHRALRVTDNSTLIRGVTAIVVAQLLVSYLFRYKVFKVFNDISDELFDGAFDCAPLCQVLSAVGRLPVVGLTL